MERYAGIPKRKISSQRIVSGRTVDWDKLIGAIKDYMRQKWPNVKLNEEWQGPGSLAQQDRGVVAAAFLIYGSEDDFSLEINISYEEDKKWTRRRRIIIEFVTAQEGKPNPFERFEVEEERPQQHPAIDGDIIHHLETQGLSELSSDRSEFDPNPKGDPVHNTISYDLKGYKLVLPPKIERYANQRIPDILGRSPEFRGLTDVIVWDSVVECVDKSFTGLGSAVPLVPETELNSRGLGRNSIVYSWNVTIEAGYDAYVSLYYEEKDHKFSISVGADQIAEHEELVRDVAQHVDNALLNKFSQPFGQPSYGYGGMGDELVITIDYKIGAEVRVVVPSDVYNEMERPDPNKVAEGS